jgi:two-component system OmpR family response regulator
METIVLVDDDPDVLDTVGFLFEGVGYQVVCAADGAALFAELESGSPDLIVLDVGLGAESGLELAMQVRKTSSIPIIMLTGKGAETDRVVGLELGADDYITKPYSSAELLARVKSVLRRSKMTQPNQQENGREVATFEGWRCDLTGHKLFSSAGEEVRLTSGEFSVLTAFIRNPGRALSRERLLDLTGRENTFDRSIDVQIMRLRRKIEMDPANPKIIQSMRSIGYIFSTPVGWT